MNSVRFGFANVRGLRSRVEGVSKFMVGNKIDIFFLVETWLVEGESFSYLNGCYTEMRLSKDTVKGNRGSEGVTVLASERVKSFISIVKKSDTKRWLVIKVADYYIACAYFPPKSAGKEEIVEFFSFLHECKEIVWENLLVVGDFNARMGSITGDSKSNERGPFFRDDILRDFALRLVSPIRGKWTTIVSNGKGITDLLLCGVESDVMRHNDLRVHEECNLYGSDHRPLSWSVPLLREYRIPRFTRYNRSKLEKAEYSSTYSNALHASFIDIFSHFIMLHQRLLTPLNSSSSNIRAHAQQTVDDMYLQLQHWIDDACRSSIGLVHIDVGVTNKGFDTDIIIEHRREMEIICEDIALLNPSTSAYRSQYRRLERVQDELKEVVKERRYQLFEEKCNTWAAAGNTTMFQKSVSAIKKRETRSGCQLDPERIDSDYAPHFESTFGCEPEGVHVPLENPLEEEWRSDCYKKANGPVDELLEECEKSGESTSISKMFSSDAIQKSLSFFSNGKAAGPDHIFAELIKHDEELTSQLLSILFKICYRFAVIPAMWSKANVVPIYKNKGDISDIGNYRPISLTCVIRRVYERQLLLELLGITENILTPNQGGFRPKRSTLQQCSALHEMMLAKPQAVIAFLDIKAAYDTVNRSLLWRDMLSHESMPSHLVAVCRSLFDFNVCNVVVNGRKSKDIHCLRGLLQGSSLSPLLFNLYIHSLIVRLNTLPKLSLQNGSVELNNLFFADDGALVADVSVVQPLLHICSEWGDEYGTQWSAPKSVILLPPKHILDPVCIPEFFFIQGGVIPFVKESFVYLGLEVKRGEGVVFEKKHDERIAKMLSTALFLKRKGMNTLGWRLSSSVSAYKSFLRPMMEYGLCFMSAKSRVIEKMEKAQNSVLNMIVSSASTSSRGAKLKLLQVVTMAERTAYLQYRFVAKLRHGCPMDAPAAMIWHASVVEGQNSTMGGRGRRPCNQPLVPKLSSMQKIFLANEIVQFVITQAPGEKELDAYLYKRKLVSLATYDKTKADGKLDVAAAIATPLRLSRITAYMDPSVSREDQRVLVALRLGELAFHQKCSKCGDECSREHAIVCSGEAMRLMGRFSHLYNMFRQTQVCGPLLFQDFLLNRMDALYHSRAQVLYQEAQDILAELIETAKCIRGTISGYVQTERSWFHPQKKKRLAAFIVLNKQKAQKNRRSLNGVGSRSRRGQSSPRVLLDFHKEHSRSSPYTPRAKTMGQYPDSQASTSSLELVFHPP